MRMFLDPFEVLSHLPLRSGSRVGDFGAGAGVYAYALAEQLPDGSVYALEALPLHVEAMRKKNLKNLYPLIADLNAHIPLKDALLDAAVIANTLHALRDRERFLGELARVMAPRAPVLIVDWMDSFKNMGPRGEDIVAPNDAVRLFESRGFAAGAMLPAGSHHYAFIATKL